MRYIHSILCTVPFYIVGTIWVAMQLSPSLVILTVLAGILFGILLSFVGYRDLSGQLCHGKSGWRFPGGIWFVIGAGVLGGCIIGMLKALPHGNTVILLPHGKTVILMIIVFIGSFVSSMFPILGWRIFKLEKKYNRKVMMGPIGFYFDEDISNQ